MSKFIKVAKLSDIPTDQGYWVEAEGVEIALFRIEDEVFAIDHYCPHQGGAMAEGGVREGFAICPWHGWEFDVRSGECEFNPSIKIRTFSVKIEGEDVFLAV